jgi:hypothetical protein
MTPKGKSAMLLTAGLMAAIALQAQQNPQTQTVQPIPHAQSALPALPDCTPTQPKPPTAAPKGFHFHLPASVQKVINNGHAQIEKKTGITVPTVSPDDLAKQGLKAPKPCTPTPTPVASVPLASTKQ